MHTQRWMSRQYFSFFVTWGIFLPYWTGWLIHVKGVTVSQASLIMSAGLVVRGLSTMFVFPWSSGRFSSRTILNGAAAGTLIVLLGYIPSGTAGSLLAVTLLLHLFYSVLMPALDSAAGVLVQRGELQQYGRSRLWGSVGFVAGGMLLTLLTGSLGEEVTLWALMAGLSAFIGLGLLSAPSGLADRPKREALPGGAIRQVFQIRHFGLVLLTVVLLQAAHASYYNYGYIYLQEIHAPQAAIGVIINIAVIAEIIFFAAADRFFGRWSVGSLLAAAALGSTVRWVLAFAFPNAAVFSVTQILHAFSFAMGHYAFMRYLVGNVPSAQIPKVQGMYSALALSWSTAVFTLFGGLLYEIKPGYAFLGMILCTVPSMLLALLYRKREAKAAV